jgi:hypothetical protein
MTALANIDIDIPYRLLKSFSRRVLKTKSKEGNKASV